MYIISCSVDEINALATPVAVDDIFENFLLHQYQPAPPTSDTSTNSWYEDFLEALSEATRCIIGDFQIFPRE